MGVWWQAVHQAEQLSCLVFSVARLRDYNNHGDDANYDEYDDAVYYGDDEAAAIVDGNIYHHYLHHHYHH